MSEAWTHKSKPRRRTVRAAKLGSAHDAIGDLATGCEIFILTFGTFSSSDAMCALLDQTGPADMVISSWTISDEYIARIHSHDNARSIRCIVDDTMPSRMEHYWAALNHLLGPENIRTCHSHAKWYTITNERWNLAVRTSANLNFNYRLEHLEISDDPKLCGFFLAVADDLFATQAPGVIDSAMPQLESIEAAERCGVIAAGKQNRSGLKSPAIGPRRTSPAKP